MRILHVIEGLNPDRGGPPVVCAALIAAQQAAGHALAAASHDAETPAARGLLAEHGARDLPVTSVPPCGFLRGAGVRRALERPERPDALHLHGVWNPIVLHAAAFARGRGLPCVISTHGSLHPWPMRSGAAKKRAALMMGYATMLRDAERVFTLNDEETESAARLVPGVRAEALPNGIDPARIGNPDPAAFRAGVPALGDRPYLVFIGRIDAVKGLDDLVRAHALVRAVGRDVDLVIVGNDWGAEADLLEAIRTAGTEEHVHRTGALHGQSKWNALAGAELFVHLPRYEGFGLAVIEALAVGTPAVMGDRCRLPGAGEAWGIVVSSSEPKAFAAGVERVLGDAALRARLSAAGHEAVHSRYTWKAIAERALAPFARALDAHTAQRR